MGARGVGSGGLQQLRAHTLSASLRARIGPPDMGIPLYRGLTYRVQLFFIFDATTPPPRRAGSASRLSRAFWSELLRDEVPRSTADLTVFSPYCLKLRIDRHGETFSGFRLRALELQLSRI